MKLTILLLLLFIITWNKQTQTLALSPQCQVCHHFIAAFQNSVPSKPAVYILQKIALQYCLRKHLQDKIVCTGAIKQMTKYIVKGLWKHYTNPHLICQQLFLCKKEYIKKNLTQDIQNILKNKPNKKWEKPSGRKVLKIMHISDLHPDLFYTPGAPVDCGEPICCRSNVTAKGNSTRKAGYWGSIGSCDVPIQTFELLLKDIKRINPDAIIWTGDNTAHDIWQQSQSYNLNFTVILSERLKKTTNSTIIPSMGNHESWPVNVYDYNSDRQQVLNAGLAQAWRYWLDENAIKMQRQKGYFSMVYQKLNNVKVVSINTQAGNHENFLLLQDPSDPGGILKWIEQQLTSSQKISQKVYIIGHIPPRSIMNDWSMRFNALVDRFSYTIRGQFYGHMHSDHISFNPEMKSASNNVDNPQLTGYYLAAPSLTTASDRVPEYRVMDIDFDTLQVLDYTQYRLDLRIYQTSDQSPQFQILYKLKQVYKINDMTIDGGMTQLRNKLRDSPQIQKLYSYHQCGGVCTGITGRVVYCDSTTSPQFHTQCNGGKYKKSKFEQVAGPWRQYIHKSQDK